MISSPWMRSSRTQPGWQAGTVRRAVEPPEGLPSPSPYPAALSRAPVGSARRPTEAWPGNEVGRGLTYETAAQPHLGDGVVVGVATQVELLV